MKSPRKRLLWMLIAGAFGIAGCIFYVQFFFRRPMGTGPAGPPVEASAFAEPWTSRRVRLVGIGDSITAGLGAKSTSHTFFNRLHQNPDDEFEGMKGICLSNVLSDLTIENLAISGSDSQAHIVTIEERLELQPTDVFGLVVMTSGGNDLIHSYGRSPARECAMYGATLEQAKPWIAAFKTRLESMLDKIESRFPGGCEIYLANIYDPTDGVGDAPSVYLPHWPDGLAIHSKYNKTIASVVDAKANVYLVPLHEEFLGHGAHCRQFWRSTYRSDDPHYWFYDNIEDPNDRGYDAIRRIFLNTIVANSSLRVTSQKN